MGGLFGVYCLPTESKALTRKGTPKGHNRLELEILLTENLLLLPTIGTVRPMSYRGC